jgi:UDP-N-acetylmuramoylalanine--D-glutamate ligase
MSLSNKIVAILGAGRSGRAAAALALREGATVHVYDQAAAISGFDSRVILHPATSEAEGASVTSDILIISPGIDTYGSLVQAFATHTGLLTGETEFAWNYYHGRTIAITGTNGKTTTTEIISHLLNANGISCVPCGNYGMPLAEVVMMENPPQVISLEVSSFQLETIHRFKPEVAVWLNFAPDHMDRYPDVESYFRAKFRIFENLDADSTIVIRHGEKLPSCPATVIHFSTENPSASWFSEGHTIFHGEEKVLAIEKDTCLRGLHNAENIMASIAAVRTLYNELDIVTPFKEYVPPPHRCELIRTLDGVEYLNDSKATNLHALESALRSQVRPVILIAGGKDKGLDYTSVLPLLQQKALAAVTFGQIAHPLGALFSQVIPTQIVTTLEEAADYAHKTAPRGSCVLLSPGTSSFDQFSGYEHRGNTFRNIINQLK